MCLGVYGKVLKISDETADVDFGGGIVKTVIVAVDGLKEGDYVVVHAGVVVSKISRKDFLKIFEDIREMAEPLIGRGEITQKDLDNLIQKDLLAETK
ncbi:MAG: HypC/HybG/HupF family hydrogenase formation chaperone [Candidatus Caldarchaeum sp.]|nr:HypC/HybG/HupF family hydrogenase formation chaperone [Candidatus Caldarchaeum sp.]MCX8201467.1 HypC/HybG/HupF family hydrogenase formation chaperone [Candidatus Caldarchaeum sp.]MDW8436158.1 HypC/HybG/HupF family hydrogenase formation chaperone [Candidatus Caldarchaeum sp.]